MSKLLGWIKGFLVQLNTSFLLNVFFYISDATPTNTTLEDDDRIPTNTTLEDDDVTKGIPTTTTPENDDIGRGL